MNFEELSFLPGSTFRSTRDFKHTYTWYVGEFEDGEYHGQGTLRTGDGLFNHDEYIGQFNHGKFEGNGTYIWADGRRYVGEWKDHHYWNGQEYCRDGKVVGKFLKGKRQPLKKREKKKPAPVIAVPRDKYVPNKCAKNKKQSTSDWKEEMAVQKQQILKQESK